MIYFQNLFLILCMLPLAFSTQAQDNREEQWKADLDLYKSGLETKHIDLYNQISKADFNAEVERIATSVPNQTDLQLTLDLMRLTRRIGDGHTAISLRNQSQHFFPFGLRHISNGWRIVRVKKGHEELLGQTLVAVDGHPVEEVAASLKPLVQFVENPYSVLFRTGDYLPRSELLYGLQLIQNTGQASFTIQDEVGNLQDVKLDAIEEKTYFDDNQFATITVSIPEIEEPENPFKDFLWDTPVKGTKALYIHFQSFPKFEEMEQFGGHLYQYIHDQEIRQIIVDLRGNSGGDLYVGLFLSYALNLGDPIDWENGVYLMTDQYTYSAAASDAALLRQLLNAKVVGMPTGSNPAGYQDLGEFELPNSKLVVTYSKRHFRLQPEENVAMQPDVLIPHEWDAYRNGRDVMLEWILDDLKR